MHIRPLHAVCIAAVIAAAACKNHRPLFERIYALEEIPVFSIELPADAAEALAKRPREWVRGAFVYQDERLEPAAIRLKGHRSLRKLGSKPSFKIELDRFGKHKLAKQTTITLNNMVEDRTLMREVLAYRLYRALGVAAPRAGFAEVTVNGEPQGLYAVIESIDKKFFKARFDDPGGPTYEGEWGCDIIPEDVEGFDNDGGTEDRSALARFAVVAAGPADKLFGDGSPLDVPAFLRFLAVEMYVGNFDGYRHGHNYRLYFEPTKGRWYFIPWGLDRTFVKSLSIFDSRGYLAKRCFADATCRTAYVRTMREVVAEARRLKLENAIEVIGGFTAVAAARESVARAALVKKRAELRAFLVARPAEVERELGCLDANGKELDRDGDGYACLDCNDGDPAIHPGVTETCDGVDNDCNGLVDDAPSCACDRIDAGGAKLSLCPLPMPYADAQRFCEARGEALVRIDDEPQRRALRDAIAARRTNRDADRWWIGLDDRAEEGKFRWVAPDSSFSAWERSAPNNAGCNQDCVVIVADSGRWSDTHCLEHHPFVCRAP